METRSNSTFQITAQPDELTCGPACLHAIYRFLGAPMALQDVITQVRQLPAGGTLAALLGLHALRRGCDVTIFTCDLQLFDPTWFSSNPPPLQDRLEAQMAIKSDQKLHIATKAYLEFLAAGGQMQMEDISPALLSQLLANDQPIIAGLSSTWLYRCARERHSDLQPDDIAGEPTGHFVVISGLTDDRAHALIADPYLEKPFPGKHHYTVDIDRLIGAILLGIVTYDAKLLIIKPGRLRCGVDS